MAENSPKIINGREVGTFFHIGPTTLMCYCENGGTCIVEYSDLYPSIIINKVSEDIECPLGKNSDNLNNTEADFE